MTRKECVDGMQRIIDEDRNKILVRVHVGYLIHAVKYLKDQPEIVMCKDCKYGEKINQVHGDDVMYLCYSPVLSSAKCVHLHGADWFCADGERKEGR